MTSNRSDTLTKNQSNSQVSENNGKSEIAEFYNGTKVLVTGGTGFQGKLLIEKLLRKVAARLVQKPSIPDEERITRFTTQWTSPQNLIDWKSYMHYSKLYLFEVPTVKLIWLVDAYAKIDKFSSVISYFSTLEWDFRNENVQKMWSKLNAVDRKLFNFNVENIDWQCYLLNNFRGIRVYLLNDPIDEQSLAKGRAKYAKLRIAHYTALTLYAMLLLRIAVSTISFLWSFCS